MRHELQLRVGPASFRIGSAWRGPVEAMRALYDLYPKPSGPCDFTVRLEPHKRARRWLRPSVAVAGDFILPNASPLALRHGLLAGEMGMNLQMALGHARHLLLHAASVERDGKAVLLTGLSGSGKSTLAALLGESGWRLMGDEFALLDLVTGKLHPFPRPVSLKNESIDLLRRRVAADRLGPEMAGTPKGRIRHLVPREEAIRRMAEPAAPALLLFPRFGTDLSFATRPVGAAESFVRLTQASTNYVTLGEPGFDALLGLVRAVPARAIDFSSSDEAISAIEKRFEAAR